MPASALQQFPRGFLWGTATASHHVEGGQHNDWSRWEATATADQLWNARPSGEACQWWAGRYAEDFDRAQQMNNNAIRFSIEWSRVEPDQGRFDDSALDRYREMAKAARDRGMTPMITLFHFTSPIWFADQGGWRNPNAPGWFATYAEKVVRALGDLCTLWCTINEPMVYGIQSYAFGAWPPALKSQSALREVTVNLLQAHADAYHAIKQVDPRAQVGFAQHVIRLEAHPRTPQNLLAARLIDSSFNRAFPLALKTGSLRFPAQRPVSIRNGKGALDWLGLQYYQVFNARIDLSAPSSFFLKQTIPTQHPTGPKPWGGLYPEGLFDQIKMWDKLFDHLPLYVTECGTPDSTDSIRLPYLAKTVRAAWKAVNFNFPVRGLFFWSLVDNFEWDKGYNPAFNFGLYQVNFETQERIARPSASLFAQICAENGLSADAVRAHVPALLAELFPTE